MDIVKACLRESNNSKDLKSAKSYMDLASSFYWVNESGQSIFMLQSLVGHEIWGNTSLWADLFTEVEHSTSNKAVILTGCFFASFFSCFIFSTFFKKALLRHYLKKWLHCLWKDNNKSCRWHLSQNNITKLYSCQIKNLETWFDNNQLAKCSMKIKV